VNKLFSSKQIRIGKVLWRDILIALMTVALGAVVAYLIVDDRWEIAAVVVFSVPALFILHRYPFLAVVAWLVLMPFLLHTTDPITRQVYWVIHRFLPPLTLLAILLPSALGLNRKPLGKFGFPEWMMFVYVAAGLVSIQLMNESPTATTYLFYDRVISPMFIYLIVRLSKPDVRMIGWLVPVMLFIAGSQAFIGMLSWFAPGMLPSEWVDSEKSRTIGTMVNTNTYITTLVLTGFLSLHFGLQSNSKWLRAAAILVFLLTVYSIFISFSRAAWLAGVLALLGVTALYPRFMLRLWLIVVPVFMLVAGAFLQDQLTWAGERLASEDSETSALSRVPVYVASVRMFAAKPWMGWGYGNFDLYDRQFQMPGAGGFVGDFKDHASHNFFLTVIAEQGLIGIVAFLAPLLYWLGVTFKHFGSLPRHGLWSRGILVIFWLTLLSHFVVYNFANMRIVFALGAWWLTLGLIARFMDSHPHAEAAGGPLRSRKKEAGRLS
jgi:O-antigen ligase